MNDGQGDSQPGPHQVYRFGAQAQPGVEDNGDLQSDVEHGHRPDGHLEEEGAEDKPQHALCTSFVEEIGRHPLRGV